MVEFTVFDRESLFDLDFEEKFSLPAGVPTPNYWGYPLLSEENPDPEFDYHPAKEDEKFGFVLTAYEIESALTENNYRLPHSFQVVDTTIGEREGSFARFELKKQDPNAYSGSKRVELSLSGTEEVNSNTWYGFSIFLSENWQEDSQSHEVIAQWINRFNSKEQGSENQEESEPLQQRFGPPVTLNVDGDSLVLKIANSLVHRHEYEDPTTIYGTISELGDLQHCKLENGDSCYIPKYQEIELSKITPGEWMDFVFHINWEHTNENGFIDVWLNNEKITEEGEDHTYKGANTYNDNYNGGVYFKSGIYKPDWADGKPSDAEKRVLYSDNFRIVSDGQQIESYESEYEFVAPWSRPEIAELYGINDSSSGDYLLSIFGGPENEALVASHLFEDTLDGFAEQPSFNSEFLSYWSEQSWFAADVDGDGIDDVLNIYNNTLDEDGVGPIATVFTHLSDGDGFQEDDAGVYSSIDTRKERELGSPVSKERGSKATRRIYSPLGMMRVVNIVHNFCRTNFPCRVIKITASPQTRKFA